MKYITKPIHDIVENRFFDLNYPGFRHSTLITSATAMQDYPLMVREDGLLIDGYKRFRCALNREMNSVEVGICQNNTDPQETIELRISSISRSHDLDILQKMSLFSWLADQISDSGLVTSWQKKLNLPADTKDLEALKVILGWSDTIKKYIHQYQMNYNQIKYFLSLEPSAINVVFELAGRLMIRPVELITISTFLSEISTREKIAIPEILNREPYLSLWSGEKLNRNQKTNRLKQLLFEQRYPMISSFQTEMKQDLNRLRFNPKLDIIYDRFFEAGNIILQMRISKPEDMMRCIDDLNNPNNQKVLESMLERL